MPALDREIHEITSWKRRLPSRLTERQPARGSLCLRQELRQGPPLGSICSSRCFQNYRQDIPVSASKTPALATERNSFLQLFLASKTYSLLQKPAGPETPVAVLGWHSPATKNSNVTIPCKLSLPHGDLFFPFKGAKP